ncbi:hypothetical protein GGI18_002685 [Coemansia linderi]|uniref:Uncharacterized protein n=1 Tax=Coemansia linderi TaxID=2663919 RepID=A0ACC1KET1_9FUNG|nr:hypothetical protein GGI18_002685 [Coemansia linderi]
MILFLDPSTAGVNSFCDLKLIPNHQQYVFTICTVAVWQYLAGIIGVISIAALFVHIIRARNKTASLLHESTQYYGPSGAVQRNTNPELLNKTLRTVIWFPITPIISLWLNMLLVSVYYYKQRVYMSLEFINVVLLALQSFFLAIALVVNPSVRYAYSEQAKRRQREKGGQANRALSNNSDISTGFPRLPTLETLSLDSLSLHGLSISSTFP